VKLQFWNGVKIDKGATLVRTVDEGVVGEGKVLSSEKVNGAWKITWKPTKTHKIGKGGK